MIGRGGDEKRERKGKERKRKVIGMGSGKAGITKVVSCTLDVDELQSRDEEGGKPGVIKLWALGQ